MRVRERDRDRDRDRERERDRDRERERERARARARERGRERERERKRKTLRKQDLRWKMSRLSLRCSTFSQPEDCNGNAGPSIRLELCKLPDE